jgi:hypothetical protein
LPYSHAIVDAFDRLDCSRGRGEVRLEPGGADDSAELAAADGPLLGPWRASRPALGPWTSSLPMSLPPREPSTKVL